MVEDEERDEERKNLLRRKRGLLSVRSEKSA